jgi:DNA-binding beta-propeller fold protein YncE
MSRLGALLLPFVLFQGCSSTGGEAAAGDDASTSDGSSSGVDASTDEGGAPTTRDVLLVGNSVAGTVSFIDEHTFDNLGSVDVIPDLQDRLAEINADPARQLAYQVILKDQTLKHFEPDGGQRFVDDVFVSPDGNTLYVSRSNLGDVAAFDLSSDGVPMLWHTRVDGYKADHAALSPDGSKLVVSATTADVADILDAKTGNLTGSFATGHYPHQNDFTADSQRIYNGSIGDVNLPYSQDSQKGVRQITVYDTSTQQVVKTYAFTEGVRPTVVTTDEKTGYLQLSYLNGLAKYDLTTSSITTTLTEPLSAFAQTNYPTQDDYPHDSAHHGLALSGDGTKLCDCGTIDDTVSIVATDTMSVVTTIDVGLIPYWATTSLDGNTCFVSLSGDNGVSVVSYATGQEVKRVPVGWFPQRSRLGKVPASVIARLSPDAG